MRLDPGRDAPLSWPQASLVGIAAVDRAAAADAGGPRGPRHISGVYRQAHQIDREIGAIAGLVMVLVGLLNVLAAPVLAHFLN